MLPRKFQSPLWFTDDELSELKGTTLYCATTLQVIRYVVHQVWCQNVTIYLRDCYVHIYLLLSKNSYFAAKIITRSV
jgi:hypothetical protein